MKLSRRMVVETAIETTVGTDPGSGYTAILTNTGSTITGKGEVIKRDVVRQSFSPAGSVIGAKEFDFSFPIELKGGGVNTGVPVEPEITTFLQACGLVKSDALVVTVDSYTKATHAFAIGEVLTKTGPANIGTIFDVVDTGTGTATLYLRDITVANIPTAASAVTGAVSTATGNVVATTRGLCYRPTSDRASMKTATIHYNLDGVRHIATACRGTFTLDLSVGKYGAFQFNLQGSYSDPTDVALPSVSYSTIIPPVVFGAGLTIGDLDMTKTATTQITYDMGNTIVPRNDVNAAEGRLGFEITGREPKGSLNPEMVTLADYNLWSLWKAATPARVYCQIGSTAGNRCRLLIPAAVYTDISYQNRDGIATYQMPFTCKEGTDGTNGDNEVYFLFT